MDLLCYYGSVFLCVWNSTEKHELGFFSTCLKNTSLRSALNLVETVSHDFMRNCLTSDLVRYSSFYKTISSQEVGEATCRTWISLN